LVISNDPAVNLMIRIVIVVVCAPIIAIILLGIGLALIYSVLIPSIFIIIFLLVTRNTKKSVHNHSKITNQYCTKCGVVISKGNTFCTKCGLKIGDSV